MHNSAAPSQVHGEAHQPLLEPVPHSATWPRDGRARLSLKWKLLAAQERARPGFMKLQVVHARDEVVDFVWDAVDSCAARMLGHRASELIGKRLCQVLADEPSHRELFEHYRRVYQSGSAEAAQQLSHDRVYRQGVVRLGNGVAVTLIDVDAVHRAFDLWAHVFPRKTPEAADSSM